MMSKWSPAHNKPLVCVHWNDAESAAPNDAFYEEEIQHTKHPMETYGLLMKEDSDGITLMTEFYLENGKGVYRGKTFIPGSIVDHVETLLKPKELKPSRQVKRASSQTLPVTNHTPIS